MQENIQTSFGVYTCCMYYVGDVNRPMYLVDLVRIAEAPGVNLSPQRTSFYMRRDSNDDWVMVRHSSLPLSHELQELAEEVGTLLASST